MRSSASYRAQSNQGSSGAFAAGVPGSCPDESCGGCVQSGVAEVAEDKARADRSRMIRYSDDALEVAGIEFIDENGGGPGVRLRKHQRSKPRK